MLPVVVIEPSVLNIVGLEAQGIVASVSQVREAMTAIRAGAFGVVFKRFAAETLAMPWDKVVVNWGSTAKNIPWSAMSVGSQTTHAMTRANLAGAVDARLKLQEIAAKDLGGDAEDVPERQGERDRL